MNIKYCIFAILLASTCLCAELDVKLPPQVSEPTELSTDPVPVTSTTEITPITPSTEAPITSTKATTTSTSTTPKPTTTTEATTTTTQPPTTTTKATTTTTQPPTTSTIPPTTTVPPTPASTPSPAPKPMPKPDTGLWSWPKDKNSSAVCVIVQFAMQLNLNYLSVDNKQLNALYNVPNNTETSEIGGQCANQTNSIYLGWKQNSLNLTFSLESNQFALSMISLSIVADNLPNAKANQTLLLRLDGTNATNMKFSTPIHMSYHCTREQLLNLTQTNLNTNNSLSTVQLSHVQFEAFHKENNVHFSTAKDCDAADTPDIVPIAVGLALAALVIVVLIAYLVGRRRNAARGYLSM